LATTPPKDLLTLLTWMMDVTVLPPLQHRLTAHALQGARTFYS
jgi:hypothetical protein